MAGPSGAYLTKQTRTFILILATYQTKPEPKRLVFESNLSNDPLLPEFLLFLLLSVLLCTHHFWRGEGRLTKL